ncbi:MAG: hypothetical protein ABIY47_13365 [Opitutaceae bacterium]
MAYPGVVPEKKPAATEFFREFHQRQAPRHAAKAGEFIAAREISFRFSGDQQ